MLGAGDDELDVTAVEVSLRQKARGGITITAFA